MGSVQSRSDNITIPFILSGNSFDEKNTIAQDAARTTDLLQYTVMAKNATSGNWVPFTSLVATTGESVPRGIYLGGDILAADLVAGNITDIPILVGGNCTVDENQVVWDDDTLSAASIVNPGTIEARTAKDALSAAANIYLEDTVDITDFEN